ncbi:hypothetical protein BCS84_10340 [Vibrio cyclitrophicus]|uniref:hypothetical protein n=1 Tax=Vibrio TaxID=662 RepID=UPI0002F9EDC3|nr:MULTISPECIES: hypothetical protein [Vibrio]OED88303.1 hypothetical protein OAQ_20295 [Vibrio cyclitrophicus ZF30]PMJ29801.1 hypothetical protein BCU25_17915 [Vibrio cyclitrophicus]PMP51867.1 hypothetical protein BCS84_02335 [Vibrio cyclitrophicus]
MLNSELIQLDTGRSLHVIEIESITKEMKNLLNKYFVSICEGDSDSEISLVKKRLVKFLETKNEATQMGAVAEFFVHLYLNQLNFKQEFLFFNLEENSIKKGFDGLFSRDTETFLVESKSGNITTKGISHKSKLNTAYSDLKDYVSGKSEKGRNNPWRNAYNHACHIDVCSEKSLRKKIKKLSEMYDDGDYTHVKDYRIIPCSTIFLNSIWDNEENSKILNENDFLKNYECSSLDAVCISKTSLELFKEYLGE